MTILALSTGLFVAEGAVPGGLQRVGVILSQQFATAADAATGPRLVASGAPKVDRLPVRDARVLPAVRYAELGDTASDAEPTTERAVLTAAAAEPAPPAPAPAAAASLPKDVDETALRYFARQGDTRRLEAEIARLRALYPNWTPPANPLDIPDAGDPQLDALWKLYSDERYAEVRQAIAQRQAAEPGWQLPPDLLERLAVAEARQKLINASNLQQYDTVVRVAADTPSLLTCSEVDVLWRLARAFSETKRPDRALDAYRYVLTSCDNSGERLATMQMAVQRLDRSAVATLLALERTGADGVGEFASVRSDVARQAVAAAADDKKKVADPSDLAALRKLAEQGGLAADQMLLGWYYLKLDDAKEAEGWFRKANAADASAEASQGLALALVALKRPAEAEAVMRPFADASDDTRAVYLAAGTNLLAVQPQVMLAPDILDEIVKQTAAAKAPDPAQLLGWYSYNLNQFATAGQWFATSLAWKPENEMAAYGLALTRERLGNRAGLLQLQAAWEGRSPRIATVGRQTGYAGQPMLQPQIAQPQVAATQPVPLAMQPLAVQEMIAGQPIVLPTVGQSMQQQPGQQQIAQAVQPMAYAPAEPQPARYGAPAPRPQRPTRPAQARSVRPASAGCRVPVAPQTLSPQAALDRGWCLMELNRPLEAAPSFEVALQGGTAGVQQQAAYGQSLAYLRVGLNDKAAVAAARAPQPRARRIELSTALLSAQATTAFEAKRPVEALMALDQLAQIQPERLDLMILRGYAYMDLRRFGDAQRVFAAAAAAGSPAGQKGLNDLRLATGQIKADG